MFGFRCSYAKMKCRCLYYFNFSDWCFGSWLEWDFGPVLHGSFNQGFAYGMQSLACFLPWDSRWDAFWWKLGYFGSFETTQIFLWVSKMVNSQDSVKNIRILQYNEFFSSFDFLRIWGVFLPLSIWQNFSWFDFPEFSDFASYRVFFAPLSIWRKISSKYLHTCNVIPV